MLRKDFLNAEIEKLAQILARIIGLKSEGKHEEANNLNHEVLTESFQLNWEELTKISNEEFRQFLLTKEYSPEKLDKLGQFLFESVYPFEDLSETHAILNQVLVVFAVLEQEYHIQSMVNLSRREMIDKFLNNQQYE